MPSLRSFQGRCQNRVSFRRSFRQAYARPQSAGPSWARPRCRRSCPSADGEAPLIQFEFSSGVHFGDQRLENGRSTFGADTLFSALFIEALKRDEACAEALLNAVRDDRLNFSDGMPFMGERYYLPKPFIHIENKEEAGDSSVKKAYKKMAYVAVDCFDAFLKGEMPLERTRDLEKLGRFDMKKIGRAHV